MQLELPDRSMQALFALTELVTVQNDDGQWTVDEENARRVAGSVLEGDQVDDFLHLLNDGVSAFNSTAQTADQGSMMVFP